MRLFFIIHYLQLRMRSYLHKPFTQVVYKRLQNAMFAITVGENKTLALKHNCYYCSTRLAGWGCIEFIKMLKYRAPVCNMMYTVTMIAYMTWSLQCIDLEQYVRT